MASIDCLSFLWGPGKSGSMVGLRIFGAWGSHKGQNSYTRNAGHCNIVRFE